MTNMAKKYCIAVKNKIKTIFVLINFLKLIIETTQKVFVKIKVINIDSIIKDFCTNSLSRIKKRVLKKIWISKKFFLAYQMNNH